VLLFVVLALAIVSVGRPVPGAAPPSPTTTSLTSSPNPSTLGANVTLTATVLPATAAGSVQFFDASTTLGAPVAVSSGTASLAIDTLGLGSHSLTAQFTPTDPSSFTGSTSPAVIQIVNPASTTTTTTTTTTSTTTPPALDHFQCYEVKPKAFAAVPNVSVEDQFGQHTETVRFPHRLCAPADKKDEFPDAPAHPDHLIGHLVSGDPVKVPHQTVVNQFGTIVLDVVRPDILLVPTLKTLAPPGPPALTQPTIDHFQCYKVKPSPGAPKFQKILGVKVDDQFGTATLDLLKPALLCAPANKQNEDPTAPDHPGHLLCYKTKHSAFGTVQTFTNSQFGPAQPLLIHRRELCVPSLKNPVPTTTTSTSTTTTTTSTTTTTTMTCSTATLQGCFADNPSMRTFPFVPQGITPAQMTIEMCQAACSGDGYKYFGLEYAQECYCGQSLPTVTANQCNFPCTGNSAEICGGPNSLSVYLCG